MQCHPNYPNLKLVYGNEWRGLPLLVNQAPFGERYLEINLSVMKQAISRHRRTFVALFILRFPYGYAIPANGCISRFIKSLKAQIVADLNARHSETGRYLTSDINFIWARELADADNCHFHVAIFLNQDAYNRIGDYSLSGDLRSEFSFSPIAQRAASLYQRINRAWARSIGLWEEQAAGLVEYPRNGEYSLDVSHQDFVSQFLDLFKRLSYMAKIRTKDYGGGADCYGASRHSASAPYSPSYSQPDNFSSATGYDF